MRHSLLALLIVGCFLIQPAACQWENAQLDTLTDNQLDDQPTAYSFVKGSDGTLHVTWYRTDTDTVSTVYRCRPPYSDWLPEEIVMEDPGIVAAACLPKNVRSDSVWMVAKYGTSLLLFQRDQAGAWTHQDITPPSQQVASQVIAAVVDSHGRWHIAFVSEESPGVYDIYYGFYHDQTWEWQDLTAPLGQFGSGAHPEMIVDDASRAHIFYRAEAWSYPIVYECNDGPGSINWTPVSMMNPNMYNYSTSAVFSREYGLCVAISGNMGFGFPGRIYYHRKPPQGDWLDPELATGTHSAVGGKLAVDTTGCPMIVWEETSGNFYTGNIFYAYNTAQWENYPLFTDSISYSPQVLMDSDNNGYLVFQTDPYPDDEEVFFYGPEPQSSIPQRNTSNPPASITLHPLYPNPMNAEGTVVFSLPTSQYLRLGIYNLLGQHVRNLSAGHYSAGDHRQVFDIADIASGYYLVVMETPTITQTQPLIILK
jgi:hypothetical protein